MRASVVRRRFRRSGAAALALGVILGMMGLLGVGVSVADTSLDFAAAAPGTYDHTAPPADATGTFGYHDGSNTFVVEQLEGGDYDCDQIVPFFTKIELGGSPSVELQYTFDSFTTGHKDGTPGLGYREVVAVTASTADPLHDAAGATLTTGTSSDAAHVYATATVGNLGASSVFVLRVDVRIGCDDGADPKDNTGNLLAHMDADLPGGAQTVPMKSAANIIEPPTTTTTTSSTTTTTSSTTTTTTSTTTTSTTTSSTTTPTSTTSTTVGPTTTTRPYVPPDIVTTTVPPTTTALPPTTTTPTTLAPVTVEPTRIVAPNTTVAVAVLGEQLARTGGATPALLAMAALCLVIGSALLVASGDRVGGETSS